MKTLVLPAPAKINRFLHITGQRDDGYHYLQTIFQFIDLMDQLEFTVRKDGEIVLHSDLPGVTNENNLIIKAAKMLKAITGSSYGAEITLHKYIPVGAGLGGGSSDAGTTLLALNHLWKLKLNTAQLIEIGVKLGADVPVFIQGCTAWAEGIGDKLTPMELPESWIALIVPNLKISTAEIFCDKALSRDTSPCKMSPSLLDLGHNDCEPVVRAHYPEVAKALDWLNQLAPARLTGTGAAIFAVLETQEQAQAIVEQTPANCRGFAVKTLNVSPVLEVLL